MQPNLFSGASDLSIPVYMTPSRGVAPELALTYSSGTGNGNYGIGFSTTLPSISRRTDTGIPKYDATDTFVLTTAGALTTKLKKEGQQWVPDEWVHTDDAGITWNVRAYVPRVEVALQKIEQWTNADTQESYWRVISAKNIITLFGKTETARIANPDNPLQIFEWLVEESSDSSGNKIAYEYKQENGANVSPEIYEVNRSYTAKRYIHGIKYGNYFPEGPSGAEAFAFEVIFDYGEYDLSNLDQPDSNPYVPSGEWKERADPFSSYRSGFEIRTFRLCRSILMFHHFPEELGAIPCLVRATLLLYEQTKSLAFLKSAAQAGYRRKPDGSYYTQYQPPLELAYSEFKPPAAPVFRTLNIQDRVPIPGYLSEASYQPVDLYGEGLPGFLYSDATTTMYYEPVGRGNYRAPAPLQAFPDTRNLQDPQLSLSDIDGNGQLELVVSTQTLSGYYQFRDDRSWGQFKPFDSVPTELMNPSGEMVDLNGDGKTDLLFVRKQNLAFYTSEGTGGYKPAQSVPREEGFPASAVSQTDVITFASIFGDGLQHRIRISSGQVSVWPNLGYGRFDEEVQFGGAPRFNPDTAIPRIYFADVDGTGAADLVFAYKDRVEVYINQSGNSFSEPITIQLPATFSDIDQISFADILGHGSTALVLTKMTPSVKHWYYEFNGVNEDDKESEYSPKPYLLTEIDNNLGAKYEIKYSSSTKFYLEDKMSGRPWVTKLPFPVQVVEKVIKTDLITGSRITNRFKYHDGYFDSAARMFRGFGFVESWDTETFEEFSNSATNPNFPVNRINAELYVPPVYTKTWFHTGSYFQSGAISKQYQEEYFSGDPDQYQLPDSKFDEAVLLAGAETLYQAYSALSGKVLHTELYAQDEGSLSAVPYTVTGRNYEVQLLQPLDGQKYASFYVRDREEISSNYERDPNDPQVQHTFTLEMTLFDPDSQNEETYLQEECVVFYARRPSINPDIFIYPEQVKVKAVVQLQRFTKVTEDFRMIGVPYESKALEVGGLELPGLQYFTFDRIKELIDEALENQIPYGVAFTPDTLQARPTSWQQSYYWGLDQTHALPLGQITERALLHHTQNAVFSDDWIQEVYGDKVNGTMLEQEGGYSDDGAGYWWDLGLVQYYFDSSQPDRFYLPWKTENVFPPQTQPPAGLFAKSTVAFNQPYYLLPVENREYIDESTALITTSEIDYNVMQHWQMTNANLVISQVLFDPLGMVIATSIFKEANGAQPKQGDGDLRNYEVRTDATFDSVIQNKSYYLQEAGSFFYYNLFAWAEGCAAGLCQPASFVSLVRQNYVTDIAPEPDNIETHIGYSDGFNRVVEEKLQAEPGDAILRDQQMNLIRDDSGKALVGFTQDRWIVSSRVVYNNKGKPTEQYLPYYSNTPYYETQQEVVDEGLVPPPKIIRYDPLSREIRIDTPKGFFSKIEFTSWGQAQYDEDDTVKDAPYYVEFFRNYPPDPTQEQQDEKAALDKAAKFYNTPKIIVVDNAGHTIRTIQNNLGDVPPDAFTEIVASTSVTSQELWDDVKASGYLETDTEPPVGTWVTGKFQPYEPGFAMTLGPDYQQFASAVTTYLLQNCLTTFESVDIQGRTLETIDPRIYYSNVQGQTDCYSFRYAFFMSAEGPVLGDTADAGQRWALPNIFDSLVEKWDSRHQQISQTYDGLQRLLTTVVTDETGAKQLTEVITYGEHQPDAQNNNLWGQIYEYQDQAGVLCNERYDLQEQVAVATRQLRQDYKNEVNWYEDVPLEDEVFQTEFHYDALKRLASEISPDGSNCRYQYFISGRLQSIEVTYPDGNVQPFVTNVVYNANNQRLTVYYGNEVTQNSTFEDTTERLVMLLTARPGVGKNNQPRSPVVQNVSYTYDPVGNMTLMRDNTAETVFCYNQQVEAKGDYTYDALYRLISATGRQHPGINADTHINGFKQSLFAFLCPPDINDEVKLENYTETYSYDNSGNLIKTAHRAVSASYTRDNPVDACSNHLQGVQYDGSGNQMQLSLNNTVGLVWDYRNNLAQTTIIERQGDTDDADYFVYDYSGQRIRKVVERYAHGGTVTEIEECIYLGSYQVKRIKKQNQTSSQTILDRQSLRVMDEQTCVAFVYYWVTDLFEREGGAGTRQVRYQVGDARGSVSVELDQADASIISYEEYFPYGGTSIIAGNDRREVEIKTYRFSGKECDDSTGLYYYGARYYITWMGRWLSPDPSGPEDGLNLYEFVGGNPTSFVDDDGMVRGLLLSLHRYTSGGFFTRGTTSTRSLITQQKRTFLTTSESAVLKEKGVQEEIRARGVKLKIQVPNWCMTTGTSIERAKRTPTSSLENFLNKYFRPTTVDVGGNRPPTASEFIAHLKQDALIISSFNVAQPGSSYITHHNIIAATTFRYLGRPKVVIADKDNTLFDLPRLKLNLGTRFPTIITPDIEKIIQNVNAYALAKNKTLDELLEEELYGLEAERVLLNIVDVEDLVAKLYAPPEISLIRKPNPKVIVPPRLTTRD